ncbi:hypothetical protein ACLB2K_040834 [Fragaria x ananassa]
MVGKAGARDRWRFTGVYGFSKVEERYKTWELLRRLGQNKRRPWLIGGDLNEIMKTTEKEGGPPRCPRQMKGFRNCMEDLEMVDMNFVGPIFTWKGRRAGQMIKCRLDRFIANKEWRDLFPMSRVTHTKPSRSDHVPICIDVSSTRIRRRKRRKRFFFEAHWLQDEECAGVIQNGWNGEEGLDPFMTLCQRIESTRKALCEWSAVKFGHLKEEI